MKYQKRKLVLQVCCTLHSTVIFRIDLVQQNQDSTYLFKQKNLAQDQLFMKNYFIKSTDFLEVSRVMNEFRLLFPFCFMDLVSSCLSIHMISVHSFNDVSSLLQSFCSFISPCYSKQWNTCSSWMSKVFYMTFTFNEMLYYLNYKEH